jgi:hypothetical protein
LTIPKTAVKSPNPTVTTAMIAAIARTIVIRCPVGVPADAGIGEGG